MTIDRQTESMRSPFVLSWKVEFDQSVPDSLFHRLTKLFYFIFKGRRSHQHNQHHPMQLARHPQHSSISNNVHVELFDQHQGTHILQSLDGFAFSLGSDGRFLYISETVSIYLGLSQVEMTGSSVFDYVHTGDHAELAQQLGLTLATTNQAHPSAGSSSATSSSQQLPPSPASGTGSVDDGNSSMNPDGN